MTRLASPHGRAHVLLPQGWVPLPDAAPGTVVALEPDDGSDRFRSNLVLTTADMAGMTFRDWQVATEELLPKMLQD